MILKIIGLIVIGLVLLISGYSFFRKTPEKYFGKAKNCHKKGEKYYDLGDPELAKDYYEEADYYRQKAEGLQENF
ncbi:MAG: hypothetical protein KKA79_02820 [Nanoarchaeota archaeon]|nr:hypothetical protein [Nanoarchaeota archaeon]MCG2718841.1 hypothetical protein [Nanoarchaeota archaeon]